MALPGIRFEVARPAPPPLGLRTDRVALIALTERGPVETPTLVAGPDTFVALFGCPLPGTLGALAAHQAFENGAQELVVTRFVPTEGASVATGTLPLTSGATLPLRLREPGAFGDRVSVLSDLERVGSRAGTQVAADELDIPDLVAGDLGRFALVHAALGDFWVRIGDVTGTVARVTPPLPTGSAPVLVELFEPTFGLRIREPGRADVRVSGLDLSDTEALREALAPTLLELDSSVLPASDLPMPGGVAPFSGGSDGLEGMPLEDPAHLDALADSFRAALDALDLSDLPDLVVAPDLWSRIWRTKGVDRLAFDVERATQLGDEMVRRAALTRDRVVLVDPPLGGASGLEPSTVDEVEQWRFERERTFASDRDYAAMAFPWVRIESEVAFRGDVTMRFPPSATVAGRMALVSRERGPWVSAGDEPLEAILGPEAPLRLRDEERLQEVGVVPLLQSAGTTRIRGVRSLAYPDRPLWRFLTTRRLFNLLQRILPPVGRSYVFEPNDPRTWVQLHRELDSVMRALYDRGALAGSTPRQAYFVRVDERLNPESERDSGTLNAEIGLAPALPLEFIVVRLAVRGEDVELREAIR